MTRKKPAAQPELASERVELRLTPSQFAEWSALAQERGCSLKALIVEAMAGHVARGDEAALAALGREVVEMVGRRR